MLYSRVTAYLSGSLPLADLEDWVLRHDPVLVQDPTSEEARLAGMIGLGIADINRNHISEDELKHEILEVVGRLPVLNVYVGDTDGIDTTRSSNTIVPTPIAMTIGMALAQAS